MGEYAQIPGAERWWEGPGRIGRGEILLRCSFCREGLASWGLDDPMTWADGGPRRKADVALYSHWRRCPDVPPLLRREAQAWLHRRWPAQYAAPVGAQGA